MCHLYPYKNVKRLLKFFFTLINIKTTEHIKITASASVELTQTRHSHSTFPSPPLPGAANPQKGRRHIRKQSTPACKIWRESARGLSRNR